LPSSIQRLNVSVSSFSEALRVPLDAQVVGRQLVGGKPQSLKSQQGVVEVTLSIFRVPLLDVAQLFPQPLKVVKSEQAAEEAVQDNPLLQQGQLVDFSVPGAHLSFASRDCSTCCFKRGRSDSAVSHTVEKSTSK